MLSYSIAATDAIYALHFIWAVLLLIMSIAGMSLDAWFKIWKRYLMVLGSCLAIAITFWVANHYWQLSIADLFHGSIIYWEDATLHGKLFAVVTWSTLASPIIAVRTIRDINRAWVRHAPEREVWAAERAAEDAAAQADLDQVQDRVADAE